MSRYIDADKLEEINQKREIKAKKRQGEQR